MSAEANADAQAPADSPGALTDPPVSSDAVGGAAPDAGGDGGRAGRDAARYRRELREEQAANVQVREQLDAFRKAEVERLATQTGDMRMHDARDLWSTGLEIADVLNDQGAVDPAKLAERTDALATERPHWFRYAGPAVNDGGSRPRPVPQVERSFGQAMSDALRPGG